MNQGENAEYYDWFATGGQDAAEGYEFDCAEPKASAAYRGYAAGYKKYERQFAKHKGIG